jgi:diacylglycerol kinase (ATP)
VPQPAYPPAPQTKPDKTSPFSLHPDVQATLSTDPDSFSPITSKSRIASFRYALAGWLYMLRTQKNIRIQTAASILVFVFGYWLGVKPIEWAVLILTILVNWMAEFLNAAIEAVVNVASPEIHPMARVSKDVAAGASLIAAVASAMIGGIILLPPLLDKLMPILAPLIQSVIGK